MKPDQIIDAVIMWVDGSDPSWIKQRSAYLNDTTLSDDQIRTMAQQYRNWDNLQYVFRSIEKNMPWIRTVHLVTNGQKPDWLNLNHIKLNWVTHENFMENEYLPSFSSHAIELNLHRISGLAEHFILFNDDLFITRTCLASDFFSQNGLPKDQCVFFRIPGVTYGAIYEHVLLNDISIINQNFSRRSAIKQHYAKFFSPKNGLLQILLSMTYLPTRHFPGFLINHMPQPYLKSTFHAVWEQEYEVLHRTSLNKFRNINDVNQYIMREWQLVTGQFDPCNIMKVSKYFSLFPKQLSAACNAITSGKYRMICINDVEVGEFETTKAAINASFAQLFPHKSGFEL